MARIDEKYKQEKQILEYFEKISDFPTALIGHFEELSLPQKAKVLAFIKVRDIYLYDKIKGIIK